LVPTAIRLRRSHLSRREQVKRTAKPSSRQLNLGLLSEVAIAVLGGKQDELARALVELLIDAARDDVEFGAEGGGDESEAYC
jgi:hypothetical protein